MYFIGNLFGYNFFPDVLTIQIKTEVKYLKDDNYYSNNVIVFNTPFSKATNNKNDTTNIKAIKVTITSPNDPMKEIVLQAFSCNIGAAPLKDRVFP